MKIDIIGRGNVGSHLASAMQNIYDVKLVNGHNLTELRIDSDLYLLTVPDNAIADVASELSGHIPAKAVLAHTSGTTHLSAIENAHNLTGVFYPLQTFSKGASLDYSVIPFFIEGNTSEASRKLMEVASDISNEVHFTDSDARLHLHLASVTACNFANHLWALSSEYMEAHGLDFKLLLPLLDETVKKIHTFSPSKVQTGPAARNDTDTVKRHIEMLNDDENLQKIYMTLSESIINKRR